MTPLKLISCFCNFSAPLSHQCSCRVLPRITFGKRAFGVFPTIPVRIPCRVNSLKADPWSRLGSCTERQTKTSQSSKPSDVFVFSGWLYRLWFTWPPKGDALLLVSLADAIVAVAVNVVAGVSVMQINVWWAVGVGTSTELWQVTWVTGLSTQGASWLQL